MFLKRTLALLTTALLAVACGGGGSGSGDGGFRLIEFLEAGQNNIPRNRQVAFRFSATVREDQDFSTRLRIQNVIQTDPSNFARAQGFYLVNGEEVIFTPALPNRPDRTDAGFKDDGTYHVFISGGGDGLQSSSGDRVPTQQEFIFETNQFFEDIVPAEPPRSLGLVAIDSTDGSVTDLSRLDPRPLELAKIDNNTLLANGRVIEPGAGGAPQYDDPWFLELRVSEPIDPSTVDSTTVRMFEVYSNAMTQAPDSAAPGHFGDPVDFSVPVSVETIQSVDENGNYDIRIRVTPAQTLVDNTRYRIVISGEVLGIDFRKTFAGDNGLTGDGQTLVEGSVYDEPGGLGYVTEFLVRDRPAITADRTLLYDPLTDGIEPESGQTTLDPENGSNTALYDPAQRPGSAVGFLSAFGNGADGPLAVSTQQIIDTGDTLNEPLGKPFTVTDLNPDDDYLADTRPGGPVTYDSAEPFELQLDSLTVSSTATLRFEGVNAVTLRVTGIVQITGILDVAGRDGGDGGKAFSNGGDAGAGGFNGADAGGGYSGRCFHNQGSGTCSDFDDYLSACASADAAFPAARNGEGPGRGLAGGDGWTYYARDNKSDYGTSGGGGASHATAGTAGEDRINLGQAPGTSGRCGPSNWPTKLAGVIGVRSMPGPVYGDREVIDVNLGGSGGGAGGANFSYQPGTNFSGGAGGGGGGSVTIIGASDIIIQGGRVDASGGNGGKGAIRNAYTFSGSTNWDKVTGGGGGGAGGTIALIAGGNLDLSGATIDASGGAGGERGNVGTAASCNACSAGGDGGKGFIFLMDADGEVDGFIPNRAGEYDNDPRGVLTISEFNADRFSSITAVTELFPMTAANPAYRDFNETSSGDLDGDDIKGLVSPDQRIRVLVSSAKSNPDDPRLPDLLSELNPYEVAVIEYVNGGTAVKVTGKMSDLNVTPGAPDREAFVRVQAKFEYLRSVEAALGPFAAIDEVKISYDFNG
ncbi:MAG: hypothetical protein ACYTHK_09630 [Planctomycetota bacterium]|jgi:hypothetical protein